MHLIEAVTQVIDIADGSGETYIAGGGHEGVDGLLHINAQWGCFGVVIGRCHELVELGGVEVGIVDEFLDIEARKGGGVLGQHAQVGIAAAAENEIGCHSGCDDHGNRIENVFLFCHIEWFSVYCLGFTVYCSSGA